MKSALLFCLGGLGDLMVAFPSIYLLRKTLFPCSLSLVCREEYGLILKETGVVDNLVSSNQARLTPLFGSPPYPLELTQWLEEFSLILGWLQKKSSLNQKEFCAFLNRKKCRFFFPSPDYSGQISQYYFEKTLEFISKKEGSVPSFRDCTFLPFASRQKGSGARLLDDECPEGNQKITRMEEKTVVVHPGSGGQTKCWPLDNFMTVIHRLSRQKIRGALVTGFAEAALEEELKKQALPNNWVWLRNPSLLRLAGLLAESTLYLGNDSGITHLAAACGTKVVALFRTDLEVAWKPYGRTTVLSGESVSGIALPSVWEVLSRSLLD